MSTINIDLAGAPPPQSLGSMVDLHVPYPAPNLIPPGQASGPHWSVALPPGAYLFVCALAGNPGPCGPVTIVDSATGNTLASVSGNIAGTPGTVCMGSIPVHFIVT